MLMNLACWDADRAGIHCLPTSSWRALAAIREVTLIYPPTGPKGQPRVLKKLTAMDQPSGTSSSCSAGRLRTPVGTTAKWRGFWV